MPLAGGAVKTLSHSLFYDQFTPFQSGTRRGALPGALPFVGWALSETKIGKPPGAQRLGQVLQNFGVAVERGKAQAKLVEYFVTGFPVDQALKVRHTVEHRGHDFHVITACAKQRAHLLFNRFGDAKLFGGRGHRSYLPLAAPGVKNSAEWPLRKIGGATLHESAARFHNPLR